MYKIKLTTVVTNHKGEPILTKDQKTFTIRELLTEIFLLPIEDEDLPNHHNKIDHIVGKVEHRFDILKKLEVLENEISLDYADYKYILKSLVRLRQPISIIKCFLDNVIKEGAE